MFMALACRRLVPGNAPGGWFLFHYSAAWVCGLTLLFVFPRDLSRNHLEILLFALALALRIISRAKADGLIPAVWDMGCILILFGLLRRRGLDPRWAALYAFNPLVLYAHAGADFFGAASTLLLLAALACWIIPFLVFRPAASWMALCLTVGVYLSKTGTPGQMTLSGLSIQDHLIVWLPFLILFSRDIQMIMRRGRYRIDDAPPESVSVIIPTKNEAGNIAECIQACLIQEGVSEVIVVDGGSEDDTAKTAGSAGAKVIRHTAPLDDGGGRGGQIHAGLQAAGGDVTVILHADIRLPADACSQMLAVLKKNPGISGGAFGCVFENPSPWFRLLEYANDFRAVFLGVSFGDQVQFFRRRPIVENDLFPNIPLMEDVEFSLRLGWAGRRAFLFGGALVSARRWEVSGAWRSVVCIRMTLTYLLRRLIGKPDLPGMYTRYYPQHRKEDENTR